MASATPPTGVSNAELIRWTFQQLNAHDLSGLRELWSADVVVRFPDRTCRGVDEVAGYFEDDLRGAARHAHRARLDRRAGRRRLRALAAHGTHDGPVQGIEGTGKPIELDGMDHFVLRDGRIVSNFVVFDQMQYSRQLGILPAQDSVGDKAMKAAFNLKTQVAKKLKERSG